MIQVMFTGNLGKDAETKTLPSGKQVTNLNVGSTPRIKRNNEWTDGETIWFQVTVWQALPPVIYSKGKTVQVFGSLEKESYEKDGQKRETLKVTASSVGIITKIESASAEPRWSAATEDKSHVWNPASNLSLIDIDPMPF